MIRPSRSLLIGLAILGSVAFGACGDTEGGAPSGPMASDEVVAGATGDATDCAAAPGEKATVEIGDFEFTPNPVQIDLCDSIVWSNVHDQSHTSTGNGDLSWSTGNIAAGAEADPIVFDTPGGFAYTCALHPFMKGIVEVS